MWVQDPKPSDGAGGLVVRIGFLKGFFKGSAVRFYGIGALIIRIEFWGSLDYKQNKEPPK